VCLSTRTISLEGSRGKGLGTFWRGFFHRVLMDGLEPAAARQGPAASTRLVPRRSRHDARALSLEVVPPPPYIYTYIYVYIFVCWRVEGFPAVWMQRGLYL